LPSVLSSSQITDQIVAFSIAYSRIKLTGDFLRSAMRVDQ